MTETTWTAIMAVPADDDPIRDLADVDGGPHATVLWFGDTDEATGDALRTAIADYLTGEGGNLRPFTVEPTHVTLLGEDEPQAVVVKLATGDSTLERIRHALLANDFIREAYEAVKQWPRFTPHLTLGYGEAVDQETRDAAVALTGVRFDRLGLWRGDNHADHPLSTPPATSPLIVLGARTFEVKHTPGGHQHNQQSHGDWSDGIAEGPDIGGTGRVKEPAAAKKPARQATLNGTSISSMSNADLEAVMMSGDIYDMDTVRAVADELDERDSIDKRTRAFHKFTTPGSPEEHALFDAVIPDQWAQWAAGAGKRKRSKAEEVEAAYQEFALAQYDRYLAENRPFFKREYHRHPPFSEQAWFMGEARRGSYLRKYGSEELQRFFAADPPMSLSDFKAEFYPWYAKAKSKVGSRYLSEYG